MNEGNAMQHTKHRGVLATLAPRPRHLVGVISLAMIAGMFALVVAPAASADTTSTGFESGFVNGTPNAQQGWSSQGSAGSGCATYYHAIVDNTYGIPSFGNKSLRISNAGTSGCFSDQTFSSSTNNEAGETDALNGGLSGGTRLSHFDASFDLASVMPTLQAGMYVSVSPDRGDGARMSYLRFEDRADGIHVFFDDYTTDFNETDIATVSRSPHTL